MSDTLCSQKGWPLAGSSSLDPFPCLRSSQALVRNSQSFCIASSQVGIFTIAIHRVGLFLCLFIVDGSEIR